MKRDIITIDDMTIHEIEAIFDLADQFLENMRSVDVPHRLRGRLDLAHESVLCTLFYEPSTRTRLSFESAMTRLGGSVISVADSTTTSSAAKGETIADTVRVVENYADVIVIRHPMEGAARAAADHVSIPVINAGDGGHEHPTQTLCDLYTLRREKQSLKGKNVLLCGDLKNGRTIHSLVYGLARFEANIVPFPAPGLDLPHHVERRLKEEYGCEFNTRDLKGVDVVYVTPTRSNQLTLLPNVEVNIRTKELLAHIDVVYATRLQKERTGNSNGAEAGYPVINSEFLKDKAYRNTRVLHPLPRVDELSYELDKDNRALYFEQAAYGIPVRMALLAALLKVTSRSLHGTEYNTTDLLGNPSKKYPEYSSTEGVRCLNSRCIVGPESREREQLSPRFWVITNGVLRCVYCETEVYPQVARVSPSKCYSDVSDIDRSLANGKLIYFSDESQAQDAGYRPKKARQKARRSRSSAST